MNKDIRYSTGFSIALLASLIITAGCAPASQPAPTPTYIEPTIVVAVPTPVALVASGTVLPAAGNDPLATDTPSPASAWPVYTLATTFPDSPKQLHLYMQAFPAHLPTQARLDAIIAQLQITGKLTTHTDQDEGGESVMTITSASGSLRLWTDAPLQFVLENGPQTPDAGTPTTIISPEVRIQTARAFLSARGLLDFPYTIEPPRLSRDYNQAVRVVPLTDGYPLYDYDPLNGRLLVMFNSAGKVSSVFWRPLKLVAGNFVDIVPASTAWDQFVKGDVPKQKALGQCWQATLFDPAEPYGVAGPVNSPGCVNWGSGPNRPYTSATISGVRLVFFAADLSLGMSPFAYAADSPARIVFPMWEFSGTTNDKRELLVLWPAIPAP